MSKLTLDEAIKHCLEVAEENDLAAGTYEILAENNHNTYERLTAETNSSRCTECAADHRQLAEWLMDYKELKNSIGAVKLKDMKDAVGLLQELNTENDQLTSQLADAKRLLKAAVEDMNGNNICYDINACKVCAKQYDITCDSFKWRYTNEVEKILND